MTEQHHRLTERELEVLALLAWGQTARRSAVELHISPHTVRAHIKNIYAKLGVNDRDATADWYWAYITKKG